MSVPVAAVLAEAFRFAGQRYVFGAEIDGQPASYVGPVDCSELVQHACYRAGVRPVMPDGAYWQWRHTRALRVTITEGRNTPGALLFVGDGTGTGRQAITHVGFSLGDGRTFEARGSRWPVGEFTSRTGWTYAALIPGVDHLPPTRPPMNRQEATRIVETAYQNYLGRDGDLAGVAHWVAQLVEGTMNEGEVIATIKGAADAEQWGKLRTLEQRVERLETRPGSRVETIASGTYRIEPIQ